MARKIICGIYCIQNKVNNKRYIGLSNNIFRRWKEHRHHLKNKHYDKENKHLIYSWHKYGKSNFEFSIIEECDLLDLSNREKYWITYYNTTDNRFGYNMTEGGIGAYTLSSYSQEEKQKIIRRGELSATSKLTNKDVLEIIQRFINGDTNPNIAKDYNVTIHTIDAIRKRKTWVHLTSGLYFEPSKRTIEVDMYTRDGKLIGTFKSFREAAKKVNNRYSDVAEVCKGHLVSVDNYIFRFHGHPFDEFPTKKKYKWDTTIDQYDLNWNYIQTFATTEDASHIANRTAISMCLHGKRNKAGGFHWLKHGEQPHKDVIKENKHYKSIDQYDKNWNYIATYSMIKQASDTTHTNKSSIFQVLNGTFKTAGGFHWLRHGEIPPVVTT